MRYLHFLKWGIMVLNISHEDQEKYKERMKNKKPRIRENRSSLLSKKFKSQAFKDFDKMTGSEELNKDVQIDVHVKMNDNFMRTGPYRAKKK